MALLPKNKWVILRTHPNPHSNSHLLYVSTPDWIITLLYGSTTCTWKCWNLIKIWHRCRFGCELECVLNITLNNFYFYFFILFFVNKGYAILYFFIGHLGTVPSLFPPKPYFLVYRQKKKKKPYDYEAIVLPFIVINYELIIYPYIIMEN